MTHPATVVPTGGRMNFAARAGAGLDQLLAFNTSLVGIDSSKVKRVLTVALTPHVQSLALGQLALAPALSKGLNFPGLNLPIGGQHHPAPGVSPQADFERRAALLKAGLQFGQSHRFPLALVASYQNGIGRFGALASLKTKLIASGVEGGSQGLCRQADAVVGVHALTVTRDP